MLHPDIGAGLRHVQPQERHAGVGQSKEFFNRFSGRGEIVEVSDLIDDAHLVSAFGLRAGLIKNNGIFEAIQKAQSAGSTLSWASVEVIDLQKALSVAIQDIAPITLLDLRGKFAPFDPEKSRQKDGLILQTALIAVALFLLILGAYYSNLQDRMARTSFEIEQGKSKHQNELVVEMIPFMKDLPSQDSQNQELGDPSSLSRLAFRDRITAARELDSGIFNDNQTSYALLDEFDHPMDRVIKTVVFGQGAGALAANADAANPSPDAHAAISATKVVLPMNSFENCGVTTDESVPKEVVLQASGQSVDIAKFSNLVREDDKIIGQIRCLIGLSPVEKPSFSPLTRSKSDVELKTSLQFVTAVVLPAIYGMLGAVIYHLRICLNPLRPDPQSIRVLLRIFLAGFAGVASSWFWQPNTSGRIDFAGVSVGVLAAAFLVGYGIDIFFNLLDQLVIVANKATEARVTPKA